jgi:hypothetical protein
VSATWAVKIAVLAILLVLAGLLFGRACGQISRQYDLVLLLDASFIQVLLFLLVAVAATAIAGGLTAALVRPLWLCAVIFVLSACAVFLGWGVSLHGAAVALVYLLVSLLYCRGVATSLDSRLKFSVEPISGSQSVLLTGLAIAASLSLYFGYAAEIEDAGFTFPPALRDTMRQMVMAPMTTQIEGRTDLTSEQKDALLAQVMQGFEEQWLGPVEESLQSVEGFVPWIVAFMLFQLLTVVNALLSWVPVVILSAIFPVLTALGVTKKLTETREVERLTLA